MGYYENLLRLYNVADPKGYSNLRKTSKRRDNVLLDSGHYSTQACSALKNAGKDTKLQRGNGTQRRWNIMLMVFGNFKGNWRNQY
jgi:hypothetical protein